MAGETIHILHIEDNPMEAMLMRELVSVSLPDEHELTGAGSLAEAIDLISSKRPDLILLDLSLPDTTGIDTIRALTPHTPGTPIIVLSGYDDEKTSLEALRAGAQDYLVKGEVSSHLLRHAIRYSVERKRLDAALATERDLVDTLLEHIPDRVYFKDLDSRYLRVNRSMANLFELEDPVDATGRSDFDFFARDYAEAAYEDERSVIESGHPLVGQIELETLRDGSTCWVLTTKMPLVASDDEVIGTFGISRDITQFKETEEELERALAQNRRLTEDLRRLASLTADEIQSAANDLQADTEPAKLRLGWTIERLRGISHLERETEALTRVDMRQVFQSALAHLAPERDPQLELVFKPANFPAALGNADLLTQLAVELLRGARVAAGEPRIEIRANESDHFLETTVGPFGALESAAEFSPARPTATALCGELAHALCQEIILLHGGELLENEAGSIRFTLPRPR